MMTTGVRRVRPLIPTPGPTSSHLDPKKSMMNAKDTDES